MAPTATLVIWGRTGTHFLQLFALCSVSFLRYSKWVIGAYCDNDRAHTCRLFDNSLARGLSSLSQYWRLHHRSTNHFQRMMAL